MEIVDKAALTAPRLRTEPFEVPGVGWVLIRSLSRTEALRLEHAGSEATKQAMIVSFGVADPVLTIAEVNAWFEAAEAGELQGLLDRLAVISGLAPDAAKAAYKSDGDGSGTGV